MNYFELFSLPESPVVDRSDLSRKYFELQRKFHPDYHADATEAEKEAMLETSSVVNKAYTVFKDDQQTIAYYLRLKGKLEDEEKYSLPADFLMEMMEVNELLDDGASGKVRDLIAATEERLDAGFHQIVADSGGEITENGLMQIKDYFFRKKYLMRILDRLND